jgi:hypothetical protein
VAALQLAVVVALDRIAADQFVPVAGIQVCRPPEDSGGHHPFVDVERTAVYGHPRAGDLLQPGNVDDEIPAVSRDVVLVAPNSSRAGYVSLALRTVSYRQRSPRPVSTTDLQVPSAEP